MPREKEGYRDVLEKIREQYGETLSVMEVAEFTGIHYRRVPNVFVGWDGRYKGKRIPAVQLARQLC